VLVVEGEDLSPYLLHLVDQVAVVMVVLAEKKAITLHFPLDLVEVVRALTPHPTDMLGVMVPLVL
tara:strand:- start:1006 stop:1200 length:195 start_codon:yes stop_codon:yes gene_type:complete